MNKQPFSKPTNKISSPQTEGINLEVSEGSYKTIRNCSVQGLSIVVTTQSSSKSVWLPPKTTVRVLESQITQQMINLHKRRLISISN